MSTERYSFERVEVGERVVLWRFRGCPSLSEWREVLDTVTLWLLDLESRGRRSGVVIDLTEQTNLGTDVRRSAGQWRADQMPLIANTCICSSYVAPNAFVRGAITAAFWFAKPVIPVSLKASRDEAIAWTQQEVHRLATIRPPE